MKWNLIMTESNNPDQIKTFDSEEDMKTFIITKTFEQHFDNDGTWINLIVKGEVLTPEDYIDAL